MAWLEKDMWCTVFIDSNCNKANTYTQYFLYLLTENHNCHSFPHFGSLWSCWTPTSGRSGSTPIASAWCWNRTCPSPATSTCPTPAAASTSCSVVRPSPPSPSSSNTGPPSCWLRATPTSNFYPSQFLLLTLSILYLLTWGHLLRAENHSYIKFLSKSVLVYGLFLHYTSQHWAMLVLAENQSYIVCPDQILPITLSTLWATFVLAVNGACIKFLSRLVLVVNSFNTTSQTLCHHCAGWEWLSHKVPVHANSCCQLFWCYISNIVSPLFWLRTTPTSSFCPGEFLLLTLSTLISNTGPPWCWLRTATISSFWSTHFAG